jgi:hypothetical protein
MQLLFRLPLALLEMVLRRGVTALLELAGLVRGEPGADDVVVATPAPAPDSAAAPAAATTPPPPPARPAPPPRPAPTAEEAIERRLAREAAAGNGGPAPAPAPASSRPRPVRETAHVDREAEIVESFGPAEDVVATIEVAVPWDGYDAMPATAIVGRLRDADPATKGVVRLYEQQHKRRATVLRATG